MKSKLLKFTLIAITLYAATLSPAFLGDVSAQQRRDDFQLVSIACGAISTGTYRMRNGEKLYLREKSFQSLEFAESALERKLATAEKIVERAPVFDEQGDKVGERAVAVFGNESAVLQASKYMLVIIEGPTLEAVLAFEKWKEEIDNRRLR